MTQHLLCGADRLKAASNPRCSAAGISSLECRHSLPLLPSLGSSVQLLAADGDASAATLWGFYYQILIASQLIWLVSSQKKKKKKKQ